MGGCRYYRAFPIPVRDLHADIEHRSVSCLFRLGLDLNPAPARKPINWKALETPFGQQVALHALRTAPTIAWEVNSTSHVAQLYAHFSSVARQWLPARATKARNPVFSAATLQLILDRQALRRTHRNVRRKQCRTLLAACIMVGGGSSESLCRSFNKPLLNIHSTH